MPCVMIFLTRPQKQSCMQVKISEIGACAVTSVVTSVVIVISFAAGTK